MESRATSWLHGTITLCLTSIQNLFITDEKNNEKTLKIMIRHVQSLWYEAVNNETENQTKAAEGLMCWDYRCFSDATSWSFFFFFLNICYITFPPFWVSCIIHKKRCHVYSHFVRSRVDVASFRELLRSQWDAERCLRWARGNDKVMNGEIKERESEGTVRKESSRGDFDWPVSLQVLICLICN